MSSNRWRATAHRSISRLSLHRLPVACILLVSMAAVLPLILRGPSCGHDFDFHLLSWMEAARDWHARLFYPNWLTLANFGAGEPRFIFYPPLSWMLGALLGTLGSLVVNPHAAWTAVPILLTAIGCFAAGCAVYALLCGFVSTRAATLTACLFVANPYLLFVAYERGAYAELLSTALLALLLLLALRETISIVPLALTVSLLWLANAPAAVMGCYLLAALAVLRLIRERKLSTPWRAATGCALGTALAGFYLVPAAYEQRWVQIERAVAEGMRIEDSFLFAHTGKNYHDQVLYTASIITVLLVGVGLISALIAWRVLPGKDRRSGLLVTFSSLLAGLLFLQLRASDIVWRTAPRLQFLQFPWRWLVVIGIVSACLLAMALDRFAARRIAPLAIAWTIGVSIWLCSHTFYQPCDADDSIAGQLAMMRDGSGVQGTDEYTARDADNSEVLQDIPPVRILTSPDAELPAPNAGDNPEWASDFYFPTTAKATATVLQWSPQYRRIQVDASQPAYAVLTLMNYPAWQVTSNGAAPSGRPHREDGLIALAIPAGRSILEVRWKTTRDVYWGRGSSLFAAVVLLVLWIKRRRGRATAKQFPH